MYRRDYNYEHQVLILIGFREIDAARRAYMIVSFQSRFPTKPGQNGYEYNDQTHNKLAIRRRTYFPKNWVGLLSRRD